MSQAINCSSCGAANQIPEGKDSMFCVFCGSSIIKIKQANDHADPTADPKIKNYLELAQNAMESSDFDEAIRYFNKVLENNPKISEAWFGKGYCSGWNGSLSNVKVNDMVTNFKKAISYVNDNSKDEMVENIVKEIDGCALSIYSLSKNHMLEFASVSGTYQEHINRSIEVINALEYAISLDSKNKSSVNSIVSITEDLRQPISYNDFDGKYHKLQMTNDLENQINGVWEKYVQIADPNRIPKLKKKQKNTLIQGIVILALAFAMAILHGAKIAEIPELIIWLLFGTGALFIIYWKLIIVPELYGGHNNEL
jgi:tetratricopeptide (TPR) repeat protein